MIWQFKGSHSIQPALHLLAARVAAAATSACLLVASGAWAGPPLTAPVVPPGSPRAAGTAGIPGTVGMPGTAGLPGTVGTTGTVGIAAIAGSYGTPARPFEANSPWNLRPDRPVLGSYVLPVTRYHPFVGQGDYSTGVFTAQAGDPPVTVLGADNQDGPWYADEEAFRPVTLPRWPATVTPARGTDGHADIIDPVSGIVHSFWQLRHDGRRWRATQYAWTRLDGRGWGDPAHYQQGARAAGVPSLAGLIRRDEIEDGLPYYRHALALSLDGSALKAGYVFPATNEDSHSASSYRGQVPMGALLMLPATFDTATLGTPLLRKVAETLKRYGARVVDQNTDTRFSVYVENGSGFDLHRHHWDSRAAEDLDRIAAALRPLVNQAGWLDDRDQPRQMATRLNLLSMRGPWTLEQGKAIGRFDSWRQAVVFAATDESVVQTQRQGNGLRSTTWCGLRARQAYRLTVRAAGGATMAVQMRRADGSLAWQSGPLGDGQSVELRADLKGDPKGDARDDPGGAEVGWRPVLTASIGRGGGGWVSAELIEIESPPALSAARNRP